LFCGDTSGGGLVSSGNRVSRMDTVVELELTDLETFIYVVVELVVSLLVNGEAVFSLGLSLVELGITLLLLEPDEIRDKPE
jgi:hypothetical protein